MISAALDADYNIAVRGISKHNFFQHIQSLCSNTATSGMQIKMTSNGYSDTAQQSYRDFVSNQELHSPWACKSSQL